MTTSIDGLRRRVQAVRKAMERQGAAREWVFILREDEEIPSMVRSKIGPNDTVSIRYVSVGYLDIEREGNWCYGYVAWPGSTLIIQPDGSLAPVPGDATRRRKRR